MQRLLFILVSGLLVVLCAAPACSRTGLTSWAAPPTDPPLSTAKGGATGWGGAGGWAGSGAGGASGGAGTTTGSGGTAGSGGTGPTTTSTGCLNMLKSDIDGFSDTLLPGGSFSIEPNGAVSATLSSASGVAPVLQLPVTIPSGGEVAGKGYVMLTVTDQGQPGGPKAELQGQLDVGIDLLSPDDRLRGWLVGTVNGQAQEHVLALSFEVLHPKASCRHRRCLQGEMLGQGSACCCGGALQPAYSPKSEEKSCRDYQLSNSNSTLRACNQEACPPHFACITESADERLQLCRPACGGNDDCRPFEVCVDGGCRPLRCDSDEDCGSGRHCFAPQLLATKYCSAKTLNGLDSCLPEMYSTPDSSCARDCQSDADCPTGWVCERRHGDFFFTGMCAPECNGRSCNRVETNFDDTMVVAKQCSYATDCVEHTGCGLWVPYWEHCSGLLFVASNQTELDAINDEWNVACGPYPPTPNCPVCNGLPTCNLKCTAGSCQGNCK